MKTEQDYINLAEEKGFTWVGEDATRTDVKTSWRCNFEHNFETSYISIKKGKQCPQCLKIKRRKQPTDYYNLGKLRGLIWLGGITQTTMHITTWQCEYGHVWDASYNNIRYNNKKCPGCRLGEMKKPLI